MLTGLIALALLMGVAALILLRATLVAPYDLRVSEIEVAIATLDPAFDGYTIVVLADLHHHPGSGGRHLRNAVRMANDANADLVALLGDYGVSFELQKRASRLLYRRSLPVLTAALRDLRARDGVVAVLGNHDHYAGAAAVTTWLSSIGARVLSNAHIVVERGGARLVIGGVDDVWEGGVDPAGGCANAPAGAPRVLLSHNPDGVLELGRDAHPSLILSGHTHGGQIVIPFYGAPVRNADICDRRTASGWIPNALAPLFVSRGVGCIVPIRFFCPPEVVVVRLHGPGTGGHGAATTERSETVSGDRSEE